MDKLQRFRINAPSVVHETIDGEAVIVNLESGNYFSLQNSALDIWSIIEEGGNGATTEDVISALIRIYGIERALSEETVCGFFSKLEEEDLIVDSFEEEPLGGDEPSVPVVEESRAEGSKFEPPLLDKHTDMQDLLLLDPIHEVDETGWPIIKEDK